MKTLARLGAVLSFSFCLLGGLWILTRVSFGSKDDILSTAIGFYFVGKAFFVGPMLWLTGDRCERKQLSPAFALAAGRIQAGGKMNGFIFFVSIGVNSWFNPAK